MKGRGQAGGLVSVIMPTHNRAELLPRAMHSVLCQTYDSLEFIVVDDASADGTQQVIQKIADERLVYLRHETNRGASASRNTGIAQAKGDLVAFLDDDDEWLPSKLEKQVSLIQSLPVSVGMVYCWMDYYDNQGRVVKKHYPTYRGYVFPYVLDRQRIGGCPTLLVRRAAVEGVGGFDEELLRGNDGDFIRRVCLEYEVDFIPEVLVRVHVGHGYERISCTGVRNHIAGQLAKLRKFKSELYRYPRQAANIYADIAYHYGKVGDWRAVSFCWKSLVTSPFMLLRSIAVFGAYGFLPDWIIDLLKKIGVWVWLRL